MELFHFPIKSRKMKLHFFGGGLYVSVAQLKTGLNIGTLILLHGILIANDFLFNRGDSLTFRNDAAALAKGGNVNNAAGGGHAHPLYNVFQFPDVSRPSVLLHRAD